MPAKAENKKTRIYLETYINNISAKLKEIDIFVKTRESHFSLKEVSKILCIPEEEIISIIKKANMKTINRFNFFKIMEVGSSEICKIYKREIEVGSPYIYSRGEIAYIYEINLDLINETCDNLKIQEVTPYTLPILFSHIAIPF